MNFRLNVTDLLQPSDIWLTETNAGVDSAEASAS